MAKGKSICANFVHASTKCSFVKLGGSYCVAFDFPGKRDMIGIAVEDEGVARALSGYFAQMAEQLKLAKKPKKSKAA